MGSRACVLNITFVMHDWRFATAHQPRNLVPRVVLQTMPGQCRTRLVYAYGLSQNLNQLGGLSYIKLIISQG